MGGYLRLGVFCLFVIVGGANHRFLVPTIAACIALSEVTDLWAILVVFGAWLLGITLSAFLR